MKSTVGILLVLAIGAALIANVYLYCTYHPPRGVSAAKLSICEIIEYLK